MVAVSLKKFFFQAEDGIRDVERSRGLGDVYKRQEPFHTKENKASLLLVRIILGQDIKTVLTTIKLM